MPEANLVSIVHKSRRSACGISIFNKHLRECLNRRGYLVRDCNLAYGDYEAASNTIIHYVPSMWADDKGALVHLVSTSIPGRIIVILHGIYGPREECYLRETKCLSLSDHVHAILNSANTIIALSQSCAEVLRQWHTEPIPAKLVTFIHPGVYCAPGGREAAEAYAFIGGIIRPKKDIMTYRMQSLVHAFWENGINLWLHCSNVAHELPELPVWRVSGGVLEDIQWSTVLANASVVLCPYDTKIQCVSGLIAEALSVGSPVVSTGFLFAREMKRTYPNHVHIEDDLSKWPELAAEVMAEGLQRPGFPTWKEFSSLIHRELIPPAPPLFAR